ncbi:hypothetical protein BEN71_02265 [Acinetobacter wuhouensis]|uniref:UDP-N-acetylglucosamine 2-epimerase n=1 Tax=Acinetobacter wuhouensis TaxID=1879050 RepID=UPI00083B082D|nr:UDP-N-acetylglucosamine 2-epimerase [Acinetobacter wuhouensis]AXQ20987.1 hypothetical protein BEN71_02265 [Acinetobacter wuhouensis]
MIKDNIFIIGTRAQLIKVAPILKEFEEKELPSKFVLTGQHNDTMEEIIEEFGIKTPITQLIKNKEHSSILALLLWLPYSFLALIKVLKQSKKSNIFVHGDTLTTLISTLAAKFTGHSVVHLESGLTSKMLFNPFPEEIIRRIVFRCTDVACCPSEQDVQHMKKYAKTEILYTHGNTILDSITYLKIGKNINREPNTILISLHRFHNIYNKERLQSIVEMLITLSEKYTINFVLHPATKKKLLQYNLLEQLTNKRINLLPRMTYQKFLDLALSNEIVITDGGSNQEELAFFGHPTIILRESTERHDGIGENAILINDPPSVVKFIISKKYTILQKEKLNLISSPSAIIANYFK